MNIDFSLKFREFREILGKCCLLDGRSMGSKWLMMILEYSGIPKNSNNNSSSSISD